MGRFKIFPGRSGIPRVLGEVPLDQAKKEARAEEKIRPGTILAEITDEGGIPVDFLTGECPKAMFD